jgi:hypothetical protein
MFLLPSQLQQISDIVWIFPEKIYDLIEDVLRVKFKQIDKDKYMIDSFNYCIIDSLLGLQELDFQVEKKGNDITIIINKI